MGIPSSKKIKIYLIEKEFINMSFKIDYNEAFMNSLIKNGDYEIVINKCFENASPGGSMYIEFDLIVRNDFEQEYKNKHIFHKVWQNKETFTYNPKSLNTIARACKLTDGKNYNELSELLDDFIGKFAKVNIKVEESEYNGKTYVNENVKYWSNSVTEECNHIQDSVTKINEKKLPF